MVVINKVIEILNRVNKNIEESKILVLGLAYKKNIDDLRESPALVIIDSLLRLGTCVKYCDPYIDHIPITKKYNFQLKSLALTSKNIAPPLQTSAPNI